ncbi:MAG TPA: AAA domain-containing protein, partial [Candidatus Obscuribacterales bacterium]
MPFDTLLNELSAALADEIDASRRDPSRNFALSNGQLVSESDDRFVYSFKAEFILPIPPETPVRVTVEKGESVNGVWVAQDDFDVLIALEENLGEEIPKAKVSSDPSFIIEELRKRLDDLKQSPPADCDLPLSLAGERTLPTEENVEAARQALICLRNLNKPELLPNSSQLEAIAKSAASRLHFVWGPPGTGKTANLAQVARALAEQGERAVILSHANAAVDVAMLKIADAFEGTDFLRAGQILRIGLPQLAELQARPELLPEGVLEKTEPELIESKRSLDSQRRGLVRAIKHARTRAEKKPLEHELARVRAELAAIRTRIAEAEKALVARARIIGATVSRFAIDDRVWSWPADAVLVDEISMVGFPFIFAASTRAKRRLLLFGDFRQLPPIVLSKEQRANKWLGRDSFEIAGIKDRIDSGEQVAQVTLLETQYRMTDEIGEVVSNFAYNGRLRPGEGVHAKTASIRQLPPWSGEPIILVDTSQLAAACVREPKIGSYSRTNPLHVSVCLTIAHNAVIGGCRSLGIITPYHAQARLSYAASRLLPANDSVGVATVHRFQGAERDFVLVDLVDSPPESSASMLTGKDPDTALRLLNVAVSRARGKLIVVADVPFIEAYHPGRSPARTLLALLRRYGTTVNLQVKDLRTLAAGFFIDWLSGWEEARDALAQDMLTSTGAIQLNLPEGFEPDRTLSAVINGYPDVASRATVFAPLPIASELEESQADLRLMTRPGGFFALLGGQVAYVGGLSSGGAVARISEKGLGGHLEKLYLAATPNIPAPSAEVEAALTAICGKCPDCGEECRPHSQRGQAWIIGC